MKKKIYKIFGVALALVFAFSTTFAFSAPAMAAEEEWDLFEPPDEAGDGDWFMDQEIDSLGPFAMAIDGTLYLYMNNTDDDADDLYKSEDEGRTWEATDYRADLWDPATTVDIVAIACYSEDADIVYVGAADEHVYKTDDAGDSWEDLGEVNDPDDEDLDAITCLDVGYADDVPHLFVGGTTTAHGEVFYYEDAPFASTWIDLDIAAPDTYVIPAGGLEDVWGIACSPDFENDTLVVAVTDNGTGSFVIANVGAGIGAENWDDMEIAQDDGDSYQITEATDPVFVEDFEIDDDYELFVGVSGDANDASDVGGVYRITGMDEEDDFLLDDVIDDIASLDLVGDLGGTSLLAGTDGAIAALKDVSVWYSTDDGDSWDETDKEPSSDATAQALVIVADDFADSGEAWCAATGANEGGVHRTTDFGATWNGISMIDTDMARNVYDIALTADYGTGDAPLFMVTEGGAATTDDSVWKYDGSYWERVWFDDTNELDLVEVSPAYASDTAVFIAESADPVILYSHDGGADFSAMVRNPDETITAWVVIDDETVITGADAGNLIYKTTRYGRRVWEEPTVPSAAGPITDLAVSPNYAADGTILAGDDESQVFISFDEGDEFEEVSDSDIRGLATLAAGNDTYVVFDPRYADNTMIYAASDDIVARVEIDTAEDMGDLEFDDLSGASPDTPAVLTSGADEGASGLVCYDDGIQAGEAVATLYVVDADDADVVADSAAELDGGVWRCLNPADTLSDVIFEQAIAGLVDGVDFSPVVGAIRNLEVAGGSNILYCIDLDGVDPANIYTYEDTLAAPVVLTSPADGEGLDSTSTVEFAWEDLNADTVAVYQIQVNEEDDFPSAADETVGTTDQDGTAATVATTDYTDDNEVTWRDEADAGTEYFWRVRVGQQTYDDTADVWLGGPVLSRWSVTRSFMTKVGAVAEPVQVRPLPGAQDINLKPSFSWLEVDGAESYEIVVSDSPEFASFLTSATPTINAWAIDIELDYLTTYYWKVRGMSADGAPAGDWVISVFTTMAEPEVAPPPVEIEVPPPAAAPEITVETTVPITPAYVWAIIAIGALLIIALIVLIVRTRRVV